MIYWDMDGVLAKYNPDSYTGDEPEYLKDGYFLRVDKDPIALYFFKECLRMYPNHTKVITGVAMDEELRFKQTLDKMTWLHQLVPEFNIGENFMAVSKQKSSCITEIKGASLSRRDILIDDFNNNLFNWEASGGTAVKYLNGFNNPGSWHGYTLSGTDVEILQSILYPKGKNFCDIQDLFAGVFNRL